MLGNSLWPVQCQTRGRMQKLGNWQICVEHLCILLRKMRPNPTLPNFLTWLEGELQSWQCWLFRKINVVYLTCFKLVLCAGLKNTAVRCSSRSVLSLGWGAQLTWRRGPCSHPQCHFCCFLSSSSSHHLPLHMLPSMYLTNFFGDFSLWKYENSQTCKQGIE